MPRPRCCRNIAGAPRCRLFKPAGQPGSQLGEISLSMEEYEAIRLADHEGLYQEDAAARMGVSRQTFGRTIAQARAKVARALVEGLALHIEAPAPCPAPRPTLRDFRCRACGRAWQEPFGTGRPAACPGCGGTDFSRSGCNGGHSAARPEPD